MLIFVTREIPEQKGFKCLSKGLTAYRGTQHWPAVVGTLVPIPQVCCCHRCHGRCHHSDFPPDGLSAALPPGVEHPFCTSFHRTYFILNVASIPCPFVTTLPLMSTTHQALFCNTTTITALTWCQLCPSPVLNALDTPSQHCTGG